LGISVKARHGTLLRSASAPTVEAALSAIFWDRKIRIPLGCGCSDRDSGRSTSQNKLYPKDASFRRAPCPACRTAGKPSILTAGKSWGSFQKSHNMIFYGMLMRPEISALNSPGRDSLSCSQASICAPGRLFAGMGAFCSFGRSLNAHFEKRSPWQIHDISGRTYNVLLVVSKCRGSTWDSSPIRIYS
jgi:hypothetical protein